MPELVHLLIIVAVAALFLGVLVALVLLIAADIREDARSIRAQIRLARALRRRARTR